MVFIILIIIIAFFILKKTLKPKIKGSFGELKVNTRLNFLNSDYTVIKDIIIKSSNGYTSQIDQLVISEYGIFVIETKNYKGWIFGNEKSENWTQVIYKEKNSFRNPIKQNWSHIYALKNVLSDYPNIQYFPIVVFSGNATLKKIESSVPVIYDNRLNSTIKRLSTIKCLTQDEVSSIKSILESAELTEKNAKLSSNYETLNERANELLNKEKSIRNSITSNEIKLQSLFNKDIFEQTKKNIVIKDKQVKFFEDRFKSIGFTKYDSISESEYNMVLSSIERYNNIIDFIADNFSYSIRENVFSGMDNNDYASAKESISREIDDLGVELEVQSRLKERASKFDMVPKNCNNIKTCVFIKDIVDAKSELLPDEDILKKENRLEELKESYEKTEKLIQDQQSMILCRQKVDDLVAIVSPVEKLSKLFTDRMCLKDIKYNVINLVKIDIDLSKYQEYSNYITSIKSYKEDIKILKEELEKMMGSSKESITLKAIIEKENEELQEVLDSKVTIISKIGTIKDEYLRIKREYETIGTAKSYKEKYSKYSEELVDIQNKIDSIMSNAKDYKELSNNAMDVSTELNSLNSKDIPILQNEIEKAKYKVVLYEQYKKDYAEYQDKFDKLQMLKKYSGINGIQTVYMGVYMNSILQEANNLLSLLFRGRFRLQPFIINEKEFILPCIDDNGNIRPDISLMSDSQLSEISMIISFVLLHKASNKYNIIKLDEVDDNLDNENRLQFTILIDKIMSLLNFEQCIIISHNNEIDLSDTDLIVTKIEDPEQHRSIISNSNVIADFS